MIITGIISNWISSWGIVEVSKSNSKSTFSILGRGIYIHRIQSDLERNSASAEILYRRVHPGQCCFSYQHTGSGFFCKTCFSQSQVFLSGNLILYIWIFIDKMIYMDSEFGRFYDNLMSSKIKINLDIIAKKTIVDKFILLTREKFKFFPNRLMLIGLMILSLSFFIYYFPFGYTKVNVIILVIMMSILLLYLNMLVSKRIRKRSIIKSY